MVVCLTVNSDDLSRKILENYCPYTKSTDVINADAYPDLLREFLSCIHIDKIQSLPSNKLKAMLIKAVMEPQYPEIYKEIVRQYTQRCRNKIMELLDPDNTIECITDAEKELAQKIIKSWEEKRLLMTPKNKPRKQKVDEKDTTSPNTSSLSSVEAIKWYYIIKYHDLLKETCPIIGDDVLELTPHPDSVLVKIIENHPAFPFDTYTTRTQDQKTLLEQYHCHDKNNLYNQITYDDSENLPETIGDLVNALTPIMNFQNLHTLHPSLRKIILERLIESHQDSAIKQCAFSIKKYLYCCGKELEIYSHNIRSSLELAQMILAYGDANNNYTLIDQLFEKMPITHQPKAMLGALWFQCIQENERGYLHTVLAKYIYSSYPRNPDYQSRVRYYMELICLDPSRSHLVANYREAVEEGIQNMESKWRLRRYPMT